MKYLKLFESESNEDYEECESYLKFFNGDSEAINIGNISKGFWKHEFINSNSISSSFSYSRKHEDDETCLIFSIYLKGLNIESNAKIDNLLKYIEDTKLLLEKSKKVINFLKHYCKDIRYQIEQGYIIVAITFSPESSQRKKTLFDRMLSYYREETSDYDSYKTIRVSNRAEEQRDFSKRTIKNILLSEIDLDEVKRLNGIKDIPLNFLIIRIALREEIDYDNFQIKIKI